MKRRGSSQSRVRGNRPRSRFRLGGGNRRRTSSSRSTIRWVWLIGLLGVGIVGSWAYPTVSSRLSDWTSVDHVTVLGTDRVRREEIVRLLDLPPSADLLSIDPQKLAERLETHRWVKTASVERVYPHTLAVTVTERQAVAVMRSPQGSHYVDDQGHLLSRAPQNRNVGLPVIEGLAPKDVERETEAMQEQAKRGVQVAQLVSRGLQAIPTVRLAPDSTIVAELPHVRFQFGGSVEEQWRRFQALYPSIQRRIDRMTREVDLRYPGKVILRKKE